MYKWLKEYFTAFGKDFPFSKVADLNETAKVGQCAV